VIKAWSIPGLLILLGAAAVADAQSSPPDIDIVPRPESLKMLTGRFVLNPETRIVAADEESRRIAGLFNDYLLEQQACISRWVPRGPADKITFRSVRPAVAHCRRKVIF